MEITKRSPLPYRSLVAPTGASGKGRAYIEDPANPGNAIVADGSKPFAGFVTRPINAGGQTLGDLVYPNRMELPFMDSDPYGAGANMISLEFAEEVVAEGYDALGINGFLYSGAGKTITAATAAKTKCSFRNGQFCIAASTDYAEWLLEDATLTPMVAGNVRARFTKIYGVLVP